MFMMEDVGGKVEWHEVPRLVGYSNSRCMHEMEHVGGKDFIGM